MSTNPDPELRKRYVLGLLQRTADSVALIGTARRRCRAKESRGALAAGRLRLTS